ncbi:MAG: hypothetical protein ABIX37_10525 [Gammaproteobacteria bacterium]
MPYRHPRSVPLALGLVLALAAWPSVAVAPLIAMLAKKVIQQTVSSMIKDTLLNSLSGMGCKGIALSNALNTLDAVRPGAGGLPGLSLPDVPALPAGMPMPALPGVGTAAMPGLAVLAGLPGMDPAMLAALPPGMADQLAAMLPASAVNAGQTAALQGAQAALSHPLSPPETVATIDELAELGFLPAEFHTELKECMVLVPQAATALGMGMGMFKPMIPKLRDARDQMHALSPAAQDELAGAMADELQDVPADDRKAFVESLDGGFFPTRVSEGVKQRLGLH